jgi:uncharacterized membrane protein YbhN (UPF0104 family)
LKSASLQEPTRHRSGLRRLLSRPVVQTAYFVLLLALTAYYLVRGGSNLPALFDRLNWSLVGLAGLILLASTLLYIFIQYTIYRGMGVRLTFRQVFSIVCPAQLGKYVPGKVLLPGSYYLLSRQAGVDVREIGGSFLISMALWLVAAVVCSLYAFSALSPVLRLGAVLLVVLLLVSVHPRVLSLMFRVSARVLQRLGRTVSAERLDQALSLPYHFYLKTLLLYLIAWFLVGLEVFVLIAALQPVAITALPASLAAAAIGTVVGFLALFAPGGLGVREGLGALILAPVTSAEVAFFVLVLLRVMTVAVDLSFGGLGLLLGRKR